MDQTATHDGGDLTVKNKTNKKGSRTSSNMESDGTEENTHYADSDFDSITSNSDSEPDLSDDERSKNDSFRADSLHSDRSDNDSPRESPKTSPKKSPNASPRKIPKTSLRKSPKNSPRKSQKTSPRKDSRASPKKSPNHSKEEDVFIAKKGNEVDYAESKNEDENRASINVADSFDDLPLATKTSETVVFEPTPPPKPTSNYRPKSMRTPRKKSALDRSFNGQIVTAQNRYSVYKDSNFPVMHGLLQERQSAHHRRAKSAAPFKSRTRSGERCDQISQSNQARPQSLYGRSNTKINLSFSPQTVESKIDSRMEDSGNPVLLSWLDNKRRIATHQHKIQKEEKRLQRYQEQQRFLQAYQKTMDSSEKVKEWIENKKRQEKLKRSGKENFFEQLKLDTIEHQKRLISPMFVKTRFCDMNPAVIDTLKQRTNKKITSPRKEVPNKLTSYEAYQKSNRETFFKYYLNDPVCPKGFSSLRSFTDNVLQDAAKELNREVSVKEGRLRRPKTALQLQELKETSENWSKQIRAISAKPPVPQHESNVVIDASKNKRINVLNQSFDKKQFPRLKTYEEWLEEKNKSRKEKMRREKSMEVDAELEKQLAVEEQKHKRVASMGLRRSRSMKVRNEVKFNQSVVAI